MDFDAVMERMKDKIGYDGSQISFRAVTDDLHGSWWGIREELLCTLLDRFELDDTREREIFQTIEDLLCNAEAASDDTDGAYVDCIIFYGDKGILAYVYDQGDGFDHKAEIEKTRKILPEVDRQAIFDPDTDIHPGRSGTYCLLTVPDEFSYNDKGNEVVAMFKL